MTAQGVIGAIETEIPVVVKEFFWKEYCLTWCKSATCAQNNKEFKTQIVIS